jgi:hypothetical protein
MIIRMLAPPKHAFKNKSINDSRNDKLEVELMETPTENPS